MRLVRVFQVQCGGQRGQQAGFWTAGAVGSEVWGTMGCLAGDGAGGWQGFPRGWGCSFSCLVQAGTEAPPL